MDESLKLAMDNICGPEGATSVIECRRLYDEINTRYYSFVVNTIQAGYRDGIASHKIST